MLDPENLGLQSSLLYFICFQWIIVLFKQDTIYSNCLSRNTLKSKLLNAAEEADAYEVVKVVETE